VEQLRELTGLLPNDPWPRLVVDTNALLDNPGLALYTDRIGTRYMAHLLPVVLREVDDHKRAGRNEALRRDFRVPAQSRAARARVLDC
jgi:hypothetical protein